MREQGLSAKPPRHRTVTTKSEKGAPVAANLLHQDFHAACPNQKWTTDTTYIWTSEGWLYLAVVLDLFSRMVACLGYGSHPGCDSGRTGETVGSGSSPDSKRDYSTTLIGAVPLLQNPIWQCASLMACW
jgi:transposase InsO family protein